MHWCITKCSFAVAEKVSENAVIDSNAALAVKTIERFSNYWKHATVLNLIANTLSDQVFGHKCSTDKYIICVAMTAYMYMAKFWPYWMSLKEKPHLSCPI